MPGWRWGRAGQGLEVDKGYGPNPARSLWLPLSPSGVCLAACALGEALGTFFEDGDLRSLRDRGMASGKEEGLGAESDG